MAVRLALTNSSFVSTRLRSVFQICSFLLLPALVSCKTTVMGPTSEAASSSFSGIKSVDTIRSTSVHLNWESNSLAQFYLVYDVSAGSGKVVGTIVSPASHGTVTGLTPSTTYQLMVRMVDSSGATDSNTVVQSVTTLSVAEDAAKYPALSVSPTSATIAVGNSVTLTTTGGTAPYSYVVYSGNGTVSSSGIFTAPSSVGTTVVRVTDAAGAQVDVTVTIQDSLVISPTTQILSVNNSVEMTATGGVAPYSFAISSGSSYGALGACASPSASCMKFTTAASLGSVNTAPVTVTVTDAVGNSAQTAITVNRALALGPTSATIGQNLYYSYFATYGAPPYTYSLTGSGSIASLTGIYLSPGSNGGPYTITVTDSQNNTATATVTVSGAAAFAGIDYVNQIGATSVNLNWTTSGTAASYVIYKVINGVSNFVGIQNAPATQYTVTGLNPNTMYTFRVRAMDSQGALDANTRDVSITTSGVSITHNGWLNIKALGAITPVSQASDLSASGAAVTVAWNAMTASEGASIQSYKIYRSTTSQGQNFSSPLASGVSASTASYTDTTVVSGTIYYYVVLPVVSGVEIGPVPGNHPLEIKVIVPPSNMVLVHRWIVNKEMCDLLQSTSDPTNNYRCPYIGLGGNGTYFDIGKSFIVDRVEMGCNYTPPNATASLSCGDSTNGCLGIASPSGTVTGNRNDVFYNRATGDCFINTHATTGTTWTSANTATLSAAQRAILGTNKPGLPPLVRLDQNRAWESCQAFTDGTFGTKRLLTHKEHILASAWDPSLSDSSITSLEAGTSFLTAGNCNTSNASGLTYDTNITPANIETIPGNTASAIKSVRTGGTSSINCVTRYGARDMIGNVWEMSSDQLSTCIGGTTNTCTGATSALDTNNTDWNGFQFDGIQGPGSSTTAISSWQFSAMSNNATQFIIPLGLPLVTGASASYGGLTIGTGAGQIDPAKLHSDNILLNTGAAVGIPGRQALSGGGYNNGTSAGRFVLQVGTRPVDTGASIGLRCTFLAE